MSRKKTTVLGVLIAIVGLIIAGMVIPPGVPMEKQTEMNKATLINVIGMAKHVPDDISWRDLAKYPDTYKGEIVKFNGKVFTIGRDHVSIQNIKFGSYSNMIDVMYPKLANGELLVSGDLVTIHAQYLGVDRGTPVVRSIIANTTGVAPTFDHIIDELAAQYLGDR